MKFTRFFFIASFVLLMFSALNAQLISVRSQLGKDSMMIGDQIAFQLHVETADHVNFLLPVLRDTLNANIEIISLLSSDTLLEEGKIIVDHSYLITGFEAGMQIIPAQEVIYESGNFTDTALSMPLVLHVFEPAVDTSQQIKPIKAPINTPLIFREILPWTGLGLGGLLLSLAIIYLVRKYRKLKESPESRSIKPLEPAHVIAFRELDRLKEEKIWEKGEVKLYYTRLTDITRRYIERQYGIPAMERTTEEIMHAFQKTNTEDGLLDEMLKDLLELADLVKFAREDPLPVDNQTNLNNAYLFIQKTYPFFFKEEPVLNKKEDSGDE